MTITTIPITFLVPPIDFATGGPSDFTLDTTNDWLAWVFYWPGGDLTKCAFLCDAASGSPVVTLQLFPVSATDGSVTTGSPIGSAVDSATLVANSVVTVSGIGQAALSAGVYAVRAIFKSGTSCGISRWRSQSGLGNIGTAQFPYIVTVTNGAAQVNVQPGSAYIDLAVGGSTFVPILGLAVPAALSTTGAFNDTSNPDEFVLWITSYPISVRLWGVAFQNLANSRPDVLATVYGGSLASPTSTFSVTSDRDQTAGTIANGFNVIPFSTKPTINAATPFGVGIRAATTHNMNLVFWDFFTGNEAVMDAGWGQNFTYGTRDGAAGAITQTTFRTPLIYPLIDGVDVGGASTGGMGGNLNRGFGS